MALEVEDGSGKSNAESYLSVADADTYWTKHGDPTDWSGSTTEQKEEALRMATQYIDLEYGGRWKGLRKVSTQALDWPRYYVEDDDGVLVDSSSIPAKLENATAEAAYRHLSESDGLMPDLEKSGSIKEYEVKAGPVGERTVYTAGASQIKFFRKIAAMLRTFLTDGSVVRA